LRIAAVVNFAGSVVTVTLFMQIEIASDRSLLVRFGESATPEGFRAVATFFQQLRSLADARILNIHPAYTTVLIDFDPLRMSHEELATIAEELLSSPTFSMVARKV
jgi:allophanate hydrolase subunit 1